MQKVVVILVLLFQGFTAQSQFKTDTSYTVKSTYDKLIKKYSFITIAHSEKNAIVDEKYNII
ncbi:MAG: hypothetical protein EOO44_11165 [Flavobacterium sp.]|nr:MAG: hypothetical protein EOO44_11165 [Flavobacterium sp.]